MATRDPNATPARRTTFAAAWTGISGTLRSPWLILGLWLVNVAVALPAAWVVAASIEQSIGPSLVHEELRSGFDMGWYGEYQTSARGLERTFTPTISGAGAFYDNFERWLTGGLFRTFPGLVGLGLIYALLWALMMGGVIDRLSRPHERMGAALFVRSGGRYFFRFVRLALISAVLYYLVYLLHREMFDWLGEQTRDVTVERELFVYSLLAYGIIAFLLVLVRIAFSYAKIATVLEERRWMSLAALRGFGFVLLNPGRTLGLFAMMLLPAVIAVGLYARVAPGPDQSTWLAVVLAFALGQVILLARLFFRLSLVGAEIELYRTRTVYE